MNKINKIECVDKMFAVVNDFHDNGEFNNAQPEQAYKKLEAALRVFHLETNRGNNISGLSSEQKIEAMNGAENIYKEQLQALRTLYFLVVERNLESRERIARAIYETHPVINSINESLIVTWNDIPRHEQDLYRESANNVMNVLKK